MQLVSTLTLRPETPTDVAVEIGTSRFAAA